MRVGPYELGAEVGRGTSGAVYRARSPDGREVALKLLVRLDPEARARFDRERRLLETLGSEGFVPILDAGEAPQGLYLVMPFLAGGTLRDRLKRGRLEIDRAVEIGIALATACGRAHVKGIVHRDLKPENILFARPSADGDDGRPLDARPLVADLGIAKHFRRDVAGASRSASLSREGALRGTALYMAPEQWASSRDVGPSADVFALGAIVYECLAGESAFVGDTAMALLQKITAGEFVPLHERRPEAPRWLAAIVERALDPDPAKRPGDGSELARALEEGDPAFGAAGSGRLAPAAAVLLLVLGGAGGLYLARGRRPASTPAPSVSTSPAKLSPGKPSPAVPRPEPLASPADSPRVAEARAHATRSFSLAAHSPEALVEAERALELAPELSDAWTARGRVHKEKRELGPALEDLSHAVELDPRSVRALKWRGVTYHALGEIELALADMNSLLALDPSDSEVWINRAGIESSHNQLDAAKADVDRGLALAPQSGFGHMLRAFVRGQLGDAAGSLEDLELAAKLEPDGPDIFSNLSVGRFLAGDYTGAVKAAERALARVPDEWQARMILGKALVALDDYAAAIPHLDRAIAFKPEGPSYSARGMAKFMVKDYEGARADLDRGIELEPTNGRPRVSRAALRQMQHDLAGALGDYEAAMSRGVATSAAILNRAYCLWELGRFEELRDYTDEALRRWPELPGVRFWRGRVRAQLGEPGASEDLRDFLERAPPNSQDAPLAREVLAKLGQK